MSKALETFDHCIKDATDLLDHFDSINCQPPPATAEVLKRASLVMAFTALETYIEDRIVEAAEAVSKGSNDSLLGNFYKVSLNNDLKYFHTPSTDRVKTIFDKYLGLDITAGWTWNNYEPARAKLELNKLVAKRGDVVHRSWRPTGQMLVAHAVTRDELRKNIRFIKDLVLASDTYLDTKR